jgi:hypothetical protein
VACISAGSIRRDDLCTRTISTLKRMLCSYTKAKIGIAKSFIHSGCQATLTELSLTVHAFHGEDEPRVKGIEK